MVTIAFYAAALGFGPLLGSFITEPAAMTLLAVVLKRRYFNAGIRATLAYATVGLLFVNISIGGVLTHFAAPPVLMVASKWGWDTTHLFQHFGWKAALSCLVSAALVTWRFRLELSSLAWEDSEHKQAASAPLAYAVVGMGAFLAGATQAPLMAILMIFEMTLSYQVMLPLMVAMPPPSNVPAPEALTSTVAPSSLAAAVPFRPRLVWASMVTFMPFSLSTLA